jgi:AraC-like DNA-binding protein
MSAHDNMLVRAGEADVSSRRLRRAGHARGYDSEAAFSREFKKAFGAAPATWRRLNR